MRDLETRRLTQDDWPAVLEVSATAFGEELAEEDSRAFLLSFPFDRSIGVFDAGRLVGTAAILSFELTLPGGSSLPMGGITWIAVLPTHRRQGILRHMMERVFADMSQRGEPLAGLFASEAGIYGRFGFGPATATIAFSVERAQACLRPAETTDAAGCGPHDTGREAACRISLLPAVEASSRIPALYEELRGATPGSTSRPPGFWETCMADPPHNREDMGRAYHALLESDSGVARGYVAYRLKEDWSNGLPSGRLEVVELLAADPGSYRALWQYLLETDLVATISCYRGHVDEPLRWLLADPRRFQVHGIYDGLWVRLLDVPRALSARTYAAAGAVTLEIRDPFPRPLELRVRLEVHRPGVAGASCGPATAAPDLVLGMEELSAVYLGGVTFAGLAAAGRIQATNRKAIEQADAMFHTDTAPFCSTDF